MAISLTTYLASWDVKSSGHNLLVLRGGLMLGHSVLQAAHGLDVRLVHKLPHLQHLAGSEDRMEITHEPDLLIA